jgi:hypothetical protein
MNAHQKLTGTALAKCRWLLVLAWLLPVMPIRSASAAQWGKVNIDVGRRGSDIPEGIVAIHGSNIPGHTLGTTSVSIPMRTTDGKTVEVHGQKIVTPGRNVTIRLNIPRNGKLTLGGVINGLRSYDKQLMGYYQPPPPKMVGRIRESKLASWKAPSSKGAGNGYTRGPMSTTAAPLHVGPRNPH